MKKVIALLQARTDSTRLPKKVLKNLLGKPMILHELERVQRSKRIGKLILLTSDHSSDDMLAQIVENAGFIVFRGSKDNVLERFYKCTKSLKLNDDDIIVRLTGDCPLHDAVVIDELVDAFMEKEVDYMANCVVPVYPDGLDVEVFTFSALVQSYREADKLSQKEHVTPYIRDSGLFKTADLDKKPLHTEWRLTVDEAEDFMLIENIYNHFGVTDFSFLDLKKYIDVNLDILDINSKINRNEGYLASLEKENTLQGKKYIEEEADKWFDRNSGSTHNAFTEYLLTLFPRKEMRQFDIAELGVGRANNVNLLSHFVNKIDGYDGSVQSIEMLNLLQQRNSNIGGKRVDLGSRFNALNKYNIIIYGFFTYMITSKEFTVLVDNSKQMLKDDGYIYIYDFLSKTDLTASDTHNGNMKIYKRNLNYYIAQLEDFDLIDFRVFDNRHLTQYLNNDNAWTIDTKIDFDDYNWTFSALFRLKKG